MATPAPRLLSESSTPTVAGPPMKLPSTELPPALSSVMPLSAASWILRPRIVVLPPVTTKVFLSLPSTTTFTIALKASKLAFVFAADPACV
jgi:hypothetical protein